MEGFISIKMALKEILAKENIQLNTGKIKITTPDLVMFVFDNHSETGEFNRNKLQNNGFKDGDSIVIVSKYSNVSEVYLGKSSELIYCNE